MDGNLLLQEETKSKEGVVGWGWGAFNRRVAGRNGQVREGEKKEKHKLALK